MKRVLLIFGFFAVEAFPLRAEDGDWQLWTDATWSQTVVQSLDTSFRWEGRMEKDISRFAYYEAEAMLIWRYSPRWNFALGYERDERLRPLEEVIHAPSLGAILKIPLQTWEVNNTFRAEFDIPEMKGGEWSFVYRNRTDVQTRWRWGSKELIPYLSEEWFLDSNHADIVQNRLSVGVNVPVAPHWMAGVYFMRQDEQTSSGWQWHPVLGVQILAQF